MKLITTCCFLIILQSTIGDSVFAGSICGDFYSSTLEVKITSNRATVEENDFSTNRGIYSMFFYWGKIFKESLQRVKSGGVWLDSGAGKANAQKQALKPTAEFPLFKGKMISLAYKFPKSTAKDEKIEYIEGKFVEDVNSDDLAENSVDVITDLYGPLSYSERTDVVLKKYFTWTREGGRIFVKGNLKKSTYLKGWDNERPAWINITTISGETLTLVEWLERIPGIKVEKNINRFLSGLNTLLLGHIGRWVNDQELMGISILMLDKEKIKVPELKLEWIQPGRPPQLRYVEIN